MITLFIKYEYKKIKECTIKNGDKNVICNKNNNKLYLEIY